MAEGHGREAWAHTAALLALTANVHRDPKKSKPFSPSDFHPYEAAACRKPVPKLKDLSVLKAVFVDQWRR
ncbi:MAG: hypothetical protein ACREJ2_03175 [Planctomycetota bacterium]